MQNPHSGYRKEAAHTEESHATSSQRKNRQNRFYILIEHDKWQDEDEDDDAADFLEYSIDQRTIDLRR